MNGGGIRAGRVYAPGSSISRRDVLAELPFNNRIVTIDIDGVALRQALENGVSQLPNAAGRFPQVSGMTVEYEPSRAPGGRIRSVTIGGAPLDPKRTYRVATNDFLARGSDGYNVFEAATPLLPPDDSPLLATEVMAYLQGLGTVRTGLEGRLVAK
jgi:5'-nucleotidase / UDP-sugar diphosphatase